MDKFDRERAESYVEERREKLEAEIERLRTVIRLTADRIEKVAFDMPAPNEHTPVFVALAIAARSEIAPPA